MVSLEIQVYLLATDERLIDTETALNERVLIKTIRKLACIKPAKTPSCHKFVMMMIIIIHFLLSDLDLYLPTTQKGT